MPRRPRSRLLLLTLLLACGPTTNATEGATSEASDSTASGPGPASTTTAPTTGAVSCDMYAAPGEIGPAVEITIKHEGTQPIFVEPGGCGGRPRVEIVDAGGATLRPVEGECSPIRCDDFLGASDCSLGCNDCAVPSLTRIEPGASVTLRWLGAHGVPTQLPLECAPGTDCQRECLQVTQAAPGAYDLRLAAFRTCTGGCTCDVPGSDWCGLWDTVEAADPVTFSVSLKYPEVTAIELPLSD
jgi:hypothetical protein